MSPDRTNRSRLSDCTTRGRTKKMAAHPAILAASYPSGGFPCAVSTAMDSKQAPRKSPCHLKIFLCPEERGGEVHRKERARKSRIKTSSTHRLIVEPRG